MTELSTASLYWPMPLKKMGATTPTSWPIVEVRGRIFEVAGSWTSCWERSDAMTEQDWLACTDPGVLLKWLQRSKRHQISDRKLRLFSCACCRRMWHLLSEG